MNSCEKHICAYSGEIRYDIVATANLEYSGNSIISKVIFWLMGKVLLYYKPVH